MNKKRIVGVALAVGACGVLAAAGMMLSKKSGAVVLDQAGNEIAKLILLSIIPAAARTPHAPTADATFPTILFLFIHPPPHVLNDLKILMRQCRFRTIYDLPAQRARIFFYLLQHLRDFFCLFHAKSYPVCYRPSGDIRSLQYTKTSR